jgi:hypothetical protein
VTDAVTLGMLTYVAEVLEIYSVIFSRVSAALFVIRLFAVTTGLKRFLYGYTIFMATTLSVTGILVFLQCTPSAGLWDPMVQSNCWPSVARSFIDNFNGGEFPAHRD